VFRKYFCWGLQTEGSKTREVGGKVHSNRDEEGEL